MAEQHPKNGDHAGRSGGSKRTQAAAQTSAGPSETSSVNKTWSEASEANRGTAGVLARRKRQYLVAPRMLADLAASPSNAIHESLKRMEDVEVLRRLRPKGSKGPGATAQPGAQEIIVARMDDQRAEAMRQSAPPHVVIEEDARIETGLSKFPASLAAPRSSRMAPTPRQRREVQFQVLGERDQPLAGASVTVLGRNFGALAITDQAGAASVTILDAEADLDDVGAVYVQPAADHWECFMQRPVLDPAGPNVVRLRPLSPADTAKPAGEKGPAWGRESMGLDQLAAGLTGTGVRIGLIDSGCDNSHPLLRHVAKGVDLTGGSGAKDWTRDEIGQGTHCAGVIAGTGDAAIGVLGIAPGAEIHVFKLSPGGRFSDLIEALDQCIESEIDIVHIGVSANQVSELVARKIVEARLRGVACIATSGDEGGPVRFPGTVPGVLCVSAVGRVGAFPADTRHALTAVPELIGPSGIFATNFSGAGPQLGVCAPGVAVISSVPGGGLAARDGAAIASAHVVGFAALILGHHPLFKGVHASRGEQRVNALFELVLGSAVRPVLDLSRVGAGLPDFRKVAMLGASDVDAWIKTMQDLGVLAGAKQGVGEGFALAGIPPAHPVSAMALMRLHAAGLV
ncbi:S8 family serine peptidase [Taklimakanibacter deserti]|uniref:S8 family serine peptidase n=1 Tax=Taklimakanibacter deserti TaxID=2267839 RepID=UPI000E64F809